MDKSIKVQDIEDAEYQSHDSCSQSSASYSIQTKPGQKIKILVVEDNMIVRFSLTEMFKNLGYSVDFVEDGKAALCQYCSDYHLILMDIDMPYLNGFEVTEIIRAIEKNHQFKKVPIVAMTSHFEEPEFQQRCLSVGMNEYLGKPNAEQLKSLILRYSNNSRN